MSTESSHLPKWAERIEQSAVPEFIDDVIDLLSVERRATNAELDYVYRIRRIAETAAHRMAESDPCLIAEATLSLLQEGFQSARDALIEWTDYGHESHLHNALSHLDNALPAIADIPMTQSSQTAQDEVLSLRRSVGQHRRNVDDEIADLESAADRTRANFDQHIQETTTAVDQIRAELTHSRDELNSLLNAARELANSQQESFSSAQERRDNSFSASQSELRSEAERIVVELERQSKQTVDSLEQLLSETSAHLERRKADVEETIGLIGEEALLGSYEVQARNERKQANRWRWISIAFVLASIAVGIWLIADTRSSDIDWGIVAAKAILLVPLGATAAYAARQSSEHRHSEREARHLELQLKAFGPYLQNLSEETGRDDLVREVALRIFGQPRADRTKNSELTDSPTSVDAIVAILKEIGKITR